MKVYSRNVAGINNPTKFHSVLNDARKFDVVMLQETKLPLQALAHLRLKWGNPDGVFMTTVGTRRGAVTLFSPRVKVQHAYVHTDPNGQFIVNVCIIEHQTFLMINVYGDPDTDARAVQTMSRVIQVMDDVNQRLVVDHTVIGGDFNFCLTESDRNSTSRKPRAEGMFLTILTTYDLFDVAALCSDAPAHTYFRHRHESTSARYDRFYVSADLVPGVTFKNLRRTGDHAPIVTEILKHRVGTKSWKFNDDLLKNAVFVQKLQDNIKESLLQFTTEPPAGNEHINNIQHSLNYDQHPSMDILTKVIKNTRNFAMKETKRLRDKNIQEEKDAVEKLIQARETFNNIPSPTDDDVDQLENAQLKLKSIQTRRANKASARNYINYASLGERSTAYHFAIANRGRPSRDIRKLIVASGNGNRALANQEIVSHMTNKFVAIARPDPIAGSLTIEEFLGPELTASARKCPQDMHDSLTRPIRKKDIEDIISGLKNMSAPGPLGITNSLLKALLPMLHSLLVQVGNDILFSDEPQDIAAWFYHRIVIFILKPGKAVTDEDSYRGLSMLENIFKLYAKELNSRIERPLRHIQDIHQFGFTKDKGCLEASRSILDAINLANADNLPLIVVSTDFYKAFDSVALDHMENALEFFEFPQKFTAAFMRLVRNGTVQFDVNGMLSDDHPLDKGTGQGDPKSGSGYNLSVAPLNHYLAKSPDVPRFEARGMEFGPVLFADDNGSLFKGDDIDGILATLRKIEEYRRVSGLTLNLSKCEILAINCNEDDIQRLIQATGMRRVTQLKHLGLIINEQGTPQHDTNIAPVLEKMAETAEQYNTSQSSPLGRALYAKYLLASKYVHRLQNMVISGEQLTSLRDSVLQMTWTRARPSDNTVSHRVHIAQDRVAQPPMYGGLGIPDPLVQIISLRFIWVRKFISADPQTTWYRILNSWLHQNNRPDIQNHLSHGCKEWEMSSQALSNNSKYWSHVFSSIAHIMEQSHKIDKEWQLIPLVGNELIPNNDLNIGSLRYANPAARAIVDAGLVNIGQLFNTTELGHIDPNSVKTRDQLQTEFNVNIPLVLMNTIASTIRAVKRCYRHTMNSRRCLPERISTLTSIARKYRSGCSAANQLLLSQQRATWSWGEFPRSYMTYQRDGFNNITSTEFSQAFRRVRSTQLAPSIQWNSTQILLRTIWTKVKEGNSRRRDNDDPNVPFDTSCLNCGQAPEHTVHIFYECNLAASIWDRVFQCFNDNMPQQQDVQAPFPIAHTVDSILFQKLPRPLNQELAKDLTETIMIVKHVLYRLRFRENLQRFPSLRLVTITVAMEMEKLASIRQGQGLSTIGIETMIDDLKTMVGF